MVRGGSGNHNRSNSGRPAARGGGSGGNSSARREASARSTASTTRAAASSSRGTASARGSTARQTSTGSSGNRAERPGHRRNAPAVSWTPPARRATTTAARTPERSNHGSGNHHASSRGTATRSPAINTRTTVGNGSRRSVSVSETPTRTTRATTNNVRPTPQRDVRHNHGSGTHHRVSQSSHRTTTTTVLGATRSSERHHHHHYHYSRAPTNDGRDYYDDEPQDVGNGLICCLCGYLCTCLGIIMGGFFTALGAILCCLPCRHAVTMCSPAATTVTGATITTSTTTVRRCKFTWWVPVVGLLMSGAVCVGLISMSTIGSHNHNFVDIDSDNLWTLTAGETRRIYLPRLVQDVSITVAEGSDPDVLAAVFRLSKCPPLTGPAVSIQHDSEFDLAGGGYEYDYYNLYPGSSIDVSFNQLAGSTYFYLLKGADALRDIQTGRNTDPSHWEKIAVLKRYITTSSGPRSNDVHYKVRGADNDIFTLVYDNASMQRDSSIDIESDLVMTTYDLGGFTPRCDNMKWRAGNYGDSCRVKARRDDCLVLESFSVAGDDGVERVISFHIDASRQWTAIGLWSAVPLALSCIICVLRCLVGSCCGSNMDPDASSAGDVAEPLLSGLERDPDGTDLSVTEEFARPPPTAPLEEEVSPSVIVIPPEDVTTLPVDPAGVKN